MDKSLLEKVKPIYEELQGYLSQCPLPSQRNDLTNSSIWTNFHRVIDILNLITKDNFDRFKVAIRPATPNWNVEHIDTTEYRSNLNALIMHLHGRYFGSEYAPFGSVPSMVVSQTQNVQITMLMDIQTLIDKQLFTADLNSDEKSFLKKIKDTLPTVTSIVQLIQLIITTAKNSGIDVLNLIRVLGL